MVTDSFYRQYEGLNRETGQAWSMPAELPAQVPGPVSPDDRDAWYAPAVRSQYPVGNGVVATVREDEDGFTYTTREPPLSETAERTRDRIEARFEDVPRSRPRTREGAAERIRDGIPRHWHDHFDSLGSLSPAATRRLGYHLGASIRALGRLTPLALDDRIRIGDTTGEVLSVHTRDFAPVRTDLPTDVAYLDSVLSERVDTKAIEFGPVEVPVTVVRRHVLGGDTFDTQYAVREPDLLPGDETLIERVKSRLVESPPRAVGASVGDAVAERARTLLGRRRHLADSKGLHAAVVDQLRRLGHTLGLSNTELRASDHTRRIDALVYYVVRDLVGDGPLTVPLRDPRVKRIEVNQIGERVTVVPHAGVAAKTDRMPATIAIDDEDEYLGLARSLAAEGGVELNVHRPAASVTVHRKTGAGTRPVHCSVALPASGPESAHISIAADRPRAPSPTELVDRGQLDHPLVALIWSVIEARGTVVFLGPPRTEPDAVLAAHAPFIPAADRPVAIEAAGRPVDLPQESAVTVQQESRASQSPADADPSREALSPDVAVMTGVETRSGSERFGRLLTSGRGLLASARVVDRRSFAHLLAETGVSPHRVSAIDLVVQLADGSGAMATARGPVVDTPVGGGEGQPTLDWERVFDATAESGSALADGFEERFDTGGAGPPLQSLVDRRTRYLEYLAADGETDRAALVDFLADLRTDEAATVERIQRAQPR